MFEAERKKEAFDWSLRNAIFEVLFKHWTEMAFKSLSFEEMKARVQAERWASATCCQTSRT